MWANTPLLTLKELGLIKITGPDSFKFLQGQLTCDVSKLTEQHASLGAYCNTKGRVLASFYIFFHNAEYYLLLNRFLIASLRQALDPYAAFQRVSITTVTDIMLRGWLRKDSNRHFKALENSRPYTLHSYPEKTVLTLPGPVPRAVVVDTDPLSTSLEADATTRIAWDRATIQSGIVLVEPEIRGLFTPHQLNYQNIGAVSFNKGCYVGQEIVARTHYLGRVSQQLYRFNVRMPHSTLVGLEITDQAGHVQGTWVAGAAMAETDTRPLHYEGLAVLRNDSIAQPLATKGASLTNIIKI